MSKIADLQRSGTLFEIGGKNLPTKAAQAYGEPWAVNPIENASTTPAALRGLDTTPPKVLRRLLAMLALAGAFACIRGGVDFIRYQHSEAQACAEQGN